jgi:DNA polymerase
MNLITLDFETYYDVRLSLSKMSTVQYVQDNEFKVWGVGVKLNDEDTVWIPEDEVKEFLEQIDWDNAALVCHNTLFDAYILTQVFGVYAKYYYDTAAMSRGLFPNESASLKHVCKRLYPDDPSMRKGEELVNAKGIRDLDPQLDEQIGGYCIQDVDLTYAIFNKMRHEFPKSEFDLMDLTVRMFVEPKLTLDRALLYTYKDQIAAETAQKIEASGTTREILASQQKFANFLEELGITVPTKRSPTTGKMIPAFGKKDSAYIQMCNMYPQYKHVWDAREAVKSRLEETRAERLLQSVNPNDSFSVPLRYYAAHTGRFGGSEKINLQNLPRESQLRNAITCKDHELLYVADLSNIEARMLAWLSRQEDLLDAFAGGTDVYCQFASQIYNRPITKDNKLERYVGKTAILGLGYGMGAEKFQYTLASGSPSVDVNIDTARSIVQQYRGTYYNIPRLWSVCKQLLFSMMDRNQIGNVYGPLSVSNNAIKLPNGMFLKYPSLQYINGEFLYKGRNDSMIRTHGPRVCENIIQALARIVITDQILTVHNTSGLDVVLTVHDEIISIGSKDNPNETLDQILAIMKKPPDWCPDLPLDAEGHFGKVYSK